MLFDSMKKAIIYFLFLITIVLVSCEESVQVSNLPFDEKIVVKGILENGLELTIYLTRTLPPLTNISSTTNRDSVYIPDAKGFIVANEDTFFLKHFGADVFKAIDKLGNVVYCEPNTHYEIHVFWNGHHCWSRTKVPSFRKVIIKNKRIDSAYVLSAQRHTLRFSFEFLDEVFESEVTEYSASLYSSNTNVGVWIFGNPLRGYLAPQVFSRDTIGSIGFNFDGRYEVKSTSRIFQDTILGFSRFSSKDTSYISIKEIMDSLSVGKLIVLRQDLPLYKYSLSDEDATSFEDFGFKTGYNPYWNVSGEGIGIFAGRCFQYIPVEF